MRKRWFSKRALQLHLAVIVWVPVCVVCGWWQVTRAFAGNSLSYLYSVEWPIFAILGAVGWWVLIHTDPDTVGAKGLRRAQRRPSTPAPAPPPVRHVEEEDEALAAYNDRLARLSESGAAKTWRRR